jgi:hypothetical protein
MQVDEKGNKYIDLTPTPDGYRVMKKTMQQGVTSWQDKLQEIEELRQNRDLRRSEIEVSEQDLVEEGLTLLERQIEGSIATLQEGIAELERCGY